MDFTNTVRILSQQDLIDAGCMDFKAAAQVIEQAFTGNQDAHEAVLPVAAVHGRREHETHR